MTRQLNRKLFNCNIIIYAIIVISSTIFWANNSLDYTTFKGDNLIFWGGYLLSLTVLFYMAQLFVFRQRRLILLFIFPFLTVITSIVLEMVLALTLPMSDSEARDIYIYGFLYSSSNILISILYLRTYYRVQQKSKHYE